MGVISTIVSFGAGYVAGMRLGNKPMVAARESWRTAIRKPRA